MKEFIKKNKVYIISYLVTVTLGTLNHFIYEWTNKFGLLKPFVSIDESVFEHLKLIYYPMIFVSIFESFFSKKNISDNLLTRNIGAISACILLVIFNFTYKSFNNNESIPLIDISSYYIFVLFGYIISIKLEKLEKIDIFRKISYILLFITIIFFSVFTEYKPNNVFFK